MIYLPSGQREKGQDLIEYALLLALLVAVGVLIYSQSGLKDSLQTIFRNSGSLMETAAQGIQTGKIIRNSTPFRKLSARPLRTEH